MSNGPVKSCQSKGFLSVDRHHNIMYLAGCYVWRGILQFYATIINQIEMGIEGWDSDFLDEPSILLLPYALSNRRDRPPQGQGSRGLSGPGQNLSRLPDNADNRAWFCRAYQRVGVGWVGVVGVGVGVVGWCGGGWGVVGWWWWWWGGGGGGGGGGGECSWPDPHRAFVPGRGPVTVQHICAKCYLTEKKKLPHPESSESCPCPAAGTTWQIPQQSPSAHSGFTSEPVTFDTVALVSSGKDFIKYMVLVDKAVHDSRKPNFIGCQIPVPSGLNFDYLEKELANYKDCDILLLLRYGCPINYEGPGCLSRVCHYHRVPHISWTT